MYEKIRIFFKYNTLNEPINDFKLIEIVLNMFLPELNLTLQRQVTEKMNNMLRRFRQSHQETNNAQYMYKSTIFIINDYYDFLCIGAYIGNKKFIIPTNCGNSGNKAVFGPNNDVSQFVCTYEATSSEGSPTLYTLLVSSFT